MDNYDEQLIQDIYDHVDNGIDWLDTEYPGWFESINAEELNMAQPSACVLGQVTPSYWDTVDNEGDGAPDSWAQDRGFDTTDALADEVGLDEAYVMLKLAWLTRITERLQKKGSN